MRTATDVKVLTGALDVLRRVQLPAQREGGGHAGVHHTSIAKAGKTRAGVEVEQRTRGDGA